MINDFLFIFLSFFFSPLKTNLRNGWMEDAGGVLLKRGFFHFSYARAEAKGGSDEEQRIKEQGRY